MPGLTPDAIRTAEHLEDIDSNDGRTFKVPGARRRAATRHPQPRATDCHAAGIAPLVALVGAYYVTGGSLSNVILPS